MNKKVKDSLVKISKNSRSKKKWQAIAGLLVMGLFVGTSVFYQVALADFYRTTGSTGFSYGYGTDGTTAGYGYGYHQSESLNTYGFSGTDGAATSVSAAPSGTTSIVVTYTTGYLAKNKIEYGLTSSLGSTTTQTAFQSGENTITLTSLTCANFYYYRVASEDAGGNTYRTSIAIDETNSCSGGSSGGGGGGGGSAASTTTTTTTTTTATISALRTQLDGLVAQLAAIIQQLVNLGGTVPEGAQQIISQTGGALTRGLTVGVRGGDVNTLQQFLRDQGADIYPEGLVTGYFGPLTRGAVQRFQLREGIVSDASDPGYGYVGPRTRARINEMRGL